MDGRGGHAKAGGHAGGGHICLTLQKPPFPGRNNPSLPGRDSSHTQFPAFAAPAHGGRFAMVAKRAGPFTKTGRANPSRPSHEEDPMTMRTSSNPFMRTQAASLKRLPHEYGAERWNGPEGARELLNNSINIDKFLKINRRKKPCKILKNNGFNVNMRACRSNKNPELFFAFRICPRLSSSLHLDLCLLFLAAETSSNSTPEPSSPPVSAYASRMRCLTNHAVFWVTHRCLASWTLEMPLREALIR